LANSLCWSFGARPAGIPEEARLQHDRLACPNWCWHVFSTGTWRLAHVFRLASYSGLLKQWSFTGVPKLLLARLQLEAGQTSGLFLEYLINDTLSHAKTQQALFLQTYNQLHAQTDAVTF
jgi:hypothetical protein